MSHYEPSDNELNAYVDAELDAATRTQVAEAIAADGKVARKVARLTALKAALPEAIPALPVIDLDAQARPSAKKPPPYKRLAIAASLLVAIAVGTLAAIQVSEMVASGETWRSAAQTQHLIWAESSKSDESPELLPAASDTAHLIAPDLSAAELRLIAFDRIKLRNFDAVRMGYAGTRGCRVSLYILDSNTPSQRPEFAWSKSTEAAEWLAGRRRYVLLSVGMDPKRFKHLAQTLELMIREPKQFDAESKQQLADAKQVSRPCAA